MSVGGRHPTRIQVGDNLLLAPRMTNCQPSAKAYADDVLEPNGVVYGQNILCSGIPRAQMRREGVKNKFLTMGLCSVCPDNVAQGGGRVARPFGFALTDPGMRLSRTRLFPRVTRVMPRSSSRGE